MVLKQAPNGFLQQPQWAAENLTFSKPLLNLAKTLLGAGEPFRPPLLQPLNVTIQVQGGTDQIAAQHVSYPCLGPGAELKKSPFIRTYSKTPNCAYGPMYELAQAAFDKVAKGLSVDESKPQAVLERRTGSIFIGHNFNSINDLSTRSRVYHFVLEYFYQRSTEQRSHGEAVAHSFRNVLGSGFSEQVIESILNGLSPADRVDFISGLEKCGDLAFIKQWVGSELLDGLVTDGKAGELGEVLRRLERVSPSYAAEIKSYLAAGSMPSGLAERAGETAEFSWSELRVPSSSSGMGTERELFQLRRPEPVADTNKRLEGSAADLAKDDIARQRKRVEAIYFLPQFKREFLDNSPVRLCPDLSNIVITTEVVTRGYVHLVTRITTASCDPSYGELIRLRWHTKIADDQEWRPGYRVETENSSHEILFLEKDSVLLDPVIHKALGMKRFEGELSPELKRKGLLPYWAEKDPIKTESGQIARRVRKLAKDADSYTLSNGQVWNSEDLDRKVEKVGHYDFIPTGTERFLEELYGKMIDRQRFAEAV